MFFGGHSSWGRKTQTQSPPKISGQSRENSVYVFFLLFLLPNRCAWCSESVFWGGRWLFLLGRRRYPFFLVCRLPIDSFRSSDALLAFLPVPAQDPFHSLFVSLLATCLLFCSPILDLAWHIECCSAACLDDRRITYSSNPCPPKTFAI